MARNGGAGRASVNAAPPHRYGDGRHRLAGESCAKELGRGGNVLRLTEAEGDMSRLALAVPLQIDEQDGEPRRVEQLRTWHHGAAVATNPVQQQHGTTPAVAAHQPARHACA